MSGGSLSAYAPGDAPLRCHHARARTTTPWDAARVKEVADRIASDTAAACEGTAPGRHTHSTAWRVEPDPGDDRWRDLWLACADALLEQFRTDPAGAGCAPPVA